MVRKETKNIRDDTLLSVVIALMTGIAAIIIGIMDYYSKIASSRYGIIEGLPAQISGVSFILIGVFLIISATRKIKIKFKKK